MTVLNVVSLIVGIAAAAGAAVIAGPAVWRFLCLPGRIDERLGKLDKLDGIEQAVAHAHEAAQRAAQVAEDAHEEWKGATAVVTREMARMGTQADREARRVDDHEIRIRRLEDEVAQCVTPPTI